MGWAGTVVRMDDLLLRRVRPGLGGDLADVRVNDGRVTSITEPGSTGFAARVVDGHGGTVLPGLVDAHSHAFQRAFAGLAERREGDEDDFWSWRDRMYRVANAVTPESLRAIAAHLYVELLRGGYTQVCEFHYLQHQADGTPYDDPLALSMALADAAADAGIGLTLLPVLYERAGFDAPALRPDQRRFHAGAPKPARSYSTGSRVMPMPASAAASASAIDSASGSSYGAPSARCCR